MLVSHLTNVVNCSGANFCKLFKNLKRETKKREKKSVDPTCQEAYKYFSVVWDVFTFKNANNGLYWHPPRVERNSNE